MKKLSFLALAAAGLMLGACSEKDVVAEESSPSVVQTNSGENFIAIAV